MARLVLALNHWDLVSQSMLVGALCVFRTDSITSPMGFDQSSEDIRRTTRRPLRDILNDTHDAIADEKFA